MGRIDQELWAPFIKQWDEAAAAGLTIDEFSELLGVNANTLRSRQFALRKRGIMLSLLRGQRGPVVAERTVIRRAANNVAAPKRGFEPVVIYVM